MATWASVPSGRTTPPWLVPVWTLILLIPVTGPAEGVVALHEGVEVLGRAVLLADLADLAAHGDRDPVGLAGADEPGQLGAQLEIELLLLVERRLGDVDQGRRVDVDVVEAGLDGLDDEVADGLELGLGVGGVLLGRGLEVVALDENRPAVALRGRGRQNGGNVFGGPLVGIADLGPGDLEDEGPGVDLPGGPEDRPGRIVGQHAQVHRRDRERLRRPRPGRGPRRAHGWRPAGCPGPGRSPR